MWAIFLTPLFVSLPLFTADKLIINYLKKWLVSERERGQIDKLFKEVTCERERGLATKGQHESWFFDKVNNWFK